MSQDDNIGAAHQVAHGCNRLHQDASPLGIAKGRGFLNGQSRFLALPNLITEIGNHGHLKLVVFLGQSGHTDTFHDGIGILQAVSKSARRRIDNNFIGLYAKVSQKDVQLFCEVYVNGRGGHYGVPITKGTRTHALMVPFFNWSQSDVLSFAGF